MEALNIDFIKEMGVVGIIAIMLVKQYQSKDNSQTTQNDILVKNLMESNKMKDELLKETVSEFKNFSASMVSKMDRIESKIEKFAK